MSQLPLPCDESLPSDLRRLLEFYELYRSRRPQAGALPEPQEESFLREIERRNPYYARYQFTNTI